MVPVVLLCLLQIRNDFYLEARQFEPYKAVGTYVGEEMQPSDVVVVQSVVSGVLGMARYMPANRPMVSWVREYREHEKNDLKTILGNPRRVLFVRYLAEWSPDKFPIDPYVESWLRDNLRLAPKQPILKENSASFKVILFENPRWMSDKRGLK